MPNESRNNKSSAGVFAKCSIFAFPVFSLRMRECPFSSKSNKSMTSTKFISECQPYSCARSVSPSSPNSPAIMILLRGLSSWAKPLRMSPPKLKSWMIFCSIVVLPTPLAPTMTVIPPRGNKPPMYSVFLISRLVLKLCRKLSKAANELSCCAFSSCVSFLLFCVVLSSLSSLRLFSLSIILSSFRKYRVCTNPVH